MHPKHQDGQALLDEMDKTIGQKVAVCSAFMMLPDGSSVLDAGCANGAASAYFALQNPAVNVIGVDYDPDYIKQAKQKYAHIQNLEFIEADLTNFDLGERKLDAILNLSILHEPYSYSGYREKTVEEIIAAELKNLKPNGVIINRDFVLPEDPNRIVYIALPDDGAHDGDNFENLSIAEFFLRYSEEAKRFNIHHATDPDGHIKGFWTEEHTQRLQGNPAIPKGWRVFAVEQQYAWEFQWRMFYRSRFLNEAEEKYAFWTHRQHREIPENMSGVRVVHSSEHENPWLMENWYQPNMIALDMALERIALAPSNFISVLRKIEPGQSVKLREYKPSKTPPSYLRMSTHLNTKTGDVVDLVSRPGDVVDILPFYKNNDGLHVLAKSDYPRPLCNIKPRMMNGNLDGKIWSGHMIEPLAAANIDSHDPDTILSVLSNRAGLNADKIKMHEAGSIHYYPAPADLAEHVHAIQVEVTEPLAGSTPLTGSHSGFSSDGIMRSYNVQSLIRAAQIGMLPEARLEVGIYNLMRKQRATPQEWIGQAIKIQQASDILPRSLDALLQEQKSHRVFEDTDKASGWLSIHRSEFHDIALVNGQETKIASQELEFIVPSQNVSTNSVMLACLVQDGDGEVLMGVQKISELQSQFAAVQSREGHSGLLTLPGLRLPNSVDHIQFIPRWISQQTGTEEQAIKRLGEGYFPSLGVMPNRIYPYVITKPSETLLDQCDFIALRELYGRLENIQDLHLINAVFRSTHALDLWSEYSQTAHDHYCYPNIAKG